MKRFLSIMLTVMLVLSSFVMVSAEETPFKVIEVTAANPGNVPINLAAGYYEISADIYVTADVTNPTIKATLSGEMVAEGTIDTAKAGKWQNVNFALLNNSADALDFTVDSGAMYVNNIKVDKAYSKKLVYEENFDNYKIGEDVSFLNVTATAGNYSGYNTQTTNPQSSFKVAANVGDKAKVGAIDYQRYYTAGTYKYADDGTRVNPTAYATPSEGYEYYYMNVPTTDADHVIIEFDLYNAANALTTDTYSLADKSKIADKLRFSVIKNDANNVHSSSAPSFTIDSKAIKAFGRTNTGSQYVASGSPVVDPQKWNKVVYELKKETVEGTVITTHTVNYGGSKVESITYGAYANFGKLVFNVDQACGGKFYIDDLKVFVVDEVANGYVERYAENFDRDEMVLGQEVDGYTYWEEYLAADPNNLTFTVDSTYDENNNPDGKGHTGNNSKYGRIYNKSIRNATAPTRYLDDGVTVDGGAVPTTGVYTNENYYKNIYKAGIGVAAVDDVKKTRLTFKYYLPGSAVDSKGNSVETLYVGFSRNNVKHTDAGESLRFKISADKAIIGSGSENKTGGHYQGIKKWIPVTIDIKSTCIKYSETDPRFHHEITYTTSGNCYGYTFTNTISGKEYHDPSMLGITVEETNGGIAYIDDIKVETNFYDATDYNILKEKERLAFENVLTKNVAVDDLAGAPYTVESATVSKDNQTITLWKAPGAANTIQVITAIFEGRVLKDAKVNANIDTSEHTAFNSFDLSLTEKVTVPETLNGETFKVFVFDTAEGLKPLANMISGDVTATETPAE